jgi:hypothetical protein
MFFLAPGREIVGSDNLCEITIDGLGTVTDPLVLIQNAWWWLGRFQDPLPLTRWTASLELGPEPTV